VSIWKDDEGRTHVGIMVRGRRIHRRLPQGASASDAKSLEADLRRAAGRREVQIPGDPLLTEIMALYMTHADTLRSPETAKHHALRAGQWMIGKRASDAPAVARKMVDDMRSHYKPATINRSLGTLKKALTLAWQRDMIPLDYGDKIRRLPENNARHEYLTIAQVKALADAASEQTRAAIWIALLTGCRRGEILKLTPADIQGKTLRIRAGNTKTLRERAVPIVPALRPWLKLLPLAINFEGLKTGFRRAREAASLTHITFHDLRHSCASLLINMGTPLEVVRDILGHTSVKTTERYAHLLIDRQREALMGLSKAVGRKK
jgi:integrase